MENFNHLIALTNPILSNPWYAVLAACWTVGWLLKNTTQVCHRCIPIVLAILGSTLGFFLLSPNLQGIIAGLTLSILSIGTHSAIKNTITDHPLE